MSIDFAANLPPKPEPESGPMAALPSVLRSLRSQQAGVVSQRSKRGLMSQRHNAVDRIEISASSRALADVQKITAEALNGLREKVSADQDALLESGRSESVEQVEQVEQVESNADFSVDGTARIILRGITGYIFGAFASQNPDMSEEDLDEFLREAKKGVDRGFAQARDYLVGMSQFDDSIEDKAEASIALVHQGLRSFVDEQRQALRERSDSDS